MYTKVISVILLGWVLYSMWWNLDQHTIIQDKADDLQWKIIVSSIKTCSDRGQGVDIVGGRVVCVNSRRVEM